MSAPKVAWIWPGPRCRGDCYVNLDRVGHRSGLVVLLLRWANRRYKRNRLTAPDGPDAGTDWDRRHPGAAGPRPDSSTEARHARLTSESVSMS